MPKLIVRAPNHLGDSIMSLSAIGAMRDLFKDSEINVIAPDFVAGIFKRHPSIDNVLSIKDGDHHGYKSTKVTRNILHDADKLFEIGILFTESLSSAAAFKLAGVTNVYGYAGNGRRLALKATLPDDGSLKHRSMRYQHLAKFAARRFWENPYWVNEVNYERPEIYFSDVERNAAKAVLIRNAIVETDSKDTSQSNPFIAIAPQAVAESRRWGTENYGALAKRIVEELEMSVVLIGSKSDHEAGEEVRQTANNDKVINLCGISKIRGAAAILECASAFVGNDSGLAHLAALVDIPLVVLSGADNPAETSPISDKKAIIEKADLDCIHCVKNICPLTSEDSMRCMSQISVDEVLQTLKSITKI